MQIRLTIVDKFWDSVNAAEYVKHCHKFLGFRKRTITWITINADLINAIQVCLPWSVWWQNIESFQFHFAMYVGTIQIGLTINNTLEILFAAGTTQIYVFLKYKTVHKVKLDNSAEWLKWVAWKIDILYQKLTNLSCFQQQVICLAAYWSRNTGSFVTANLSQICSKM